MKILAGGCFVAIAVAVGTVFSALRPSGEPAGGHKDGSLEQPGRAQSSVGREPQIDLPPGFHDEKVAGVAAPTSLAFPGDGRLLVSSQKGKLVLVESGSSTTILDLTLRTCSRIEQGLLGMALDPFFARNRHIYLYYTARQGKACVNRVSRFIFGEHRVDPGSETVLIDGIVSKRGNHNGGDLQFGPDGNLYVSVGDGGCDYAGSGCHGKNNASRDLHVLLGKVLRISAGGEVPPDNPFLGPDTESCSLTGKTEPGKVCRETYLWGLRNPFRIAFDRNPGAGNRFFVNDPGQDKWEEINEAVAGADYGWNLREGRCLNRSPRGCGTPQPGLTDPIFDYPHSRKRNCRAITGGAFVPQGTWPAPFGGSYLFADFGCGEISRLEAGPDGEYRAKKFAGGFGAASLVHMAFGPHGAGTALYLTSYSGGGEVRRLSRRGAESTQPGGPWTGR